jgi:hypothetical protein
MAKPMATHSGMNPGYVALRYTGLIGVRGTVTAEFLSPAWFYVLGYCSELIGRRKRHIVDVISNAVTPLRVLQCSVI